jgi:hypothetical protein
MSRQIIEVSGVQDSLFLWHSLTKGVHVGRRVPVVRASEGVEGYHDGKLQVFLYEIYRQWIRWEVNYTKPLHWIPSVIWDTCALTKKYISESQILTYISVQFWNWEWLGNFSLCCCSYQVAFLRAFDEVADFYRSQLITSETRRGIVVATALEA